jgi:RecA-family ATPase
MTAAWDDFIARASAESEADADAARRRQANGHDEGSDPPSAALWIDADGWDEADISTRPWIAPGYALRGAITVIAGPPSAAKSSLMLAWACAVALGQEHGDLRPTAAGSVIIYNVEDDQAEQRRRLSAALRQFDAAPADIAGKVIRAGPAGIGTLFSRDASGALSSTAAMARLRELIAERRPALLIADPFAELHVEEENDNTATRAVIAAFRALAVEFNIAIILVHHTRKGTLATQTAPAAPPRSSAPRASSRR